MHEEKPVIKRLSFAPDEADQTLLAAAEVRVGAGEFATFNDLCKAALQAFLAPAATSLSATPVAPEIDAKLARIAAELAALRAAQEATAMQAGREAELAQPEWVTTLQHAQEELCSASQSLQATLQGEIRSFRVELMAAIDGLTSPHPAASGRGLDARPAYQVASIETVTIDEDVVARLAHFLEDF